jgi:excinuclease ABC subunit A
VNGGKIVVEGTPETVAANADSATGQYLGPLLERATVKPIIEDVPVKRVKRSRKVAVDEPELMSAK